MNNSPTIFLQMLMNSKLDGGFKYLLFLSQTLGKISILAHIFGLG